MKFAILYKDRVVETLSGNQTMTVHCGNKSLESNIVIKDITETGTFDIHDTDEQKTCIFEIGMTWGQFVKYYGYPFYINSTDGTIYSVYASSLVYYNDVVLTVTDSVIDGAVYTTTSLSSSGGSND